MASVSFPADVSAFEFGDDEGPHARGERHM
jgi:hypothetical protein